jgi:hypothetical protein
MWKAFWKDPVWAAVISAGIVSAAGAGGMYLLGLWPAISDLAGTLLRAASEQSKWSNWQVWMAVALAIPSLLLALALLWNVIRPLRSVDDWRNLYTEEKLVGLRWRWKYYSDGSLGDIHSFCPHCDFQVFPHQASAYSAIDRIGFHCDSCGRDLATFDQPFEHLESRVRRLIQQKIRVGSWRQQE